jgi:hypothetical protein
MIIGCIPRVVPKLALGISRDCLSKAAMTDETISPIEMRVPGIVDATLGEASTVAIIETAETTS